MSDPRRLALPWLLSAMVGGHLAAVESDMPDLVLASKLLQAPEANLTGLDDQFQLHPKLLATASYEHHEDAGNPVYDDPAVGIITGAEALWSPVQHHLFTAQALGGNSYSGYDGRGKWIGSAAIDWRYIGERWGNRVGALVEMDQQDMVQSGRPYRRADADLIDHFTYEDRSLTWAVIPRFHRERYVEHSELWDGSERDSEGTSVQSTLAWRSASRVTWNGLVAGGNLDYVANGPYRDTHVIRAGGGQAIGLTERISATWNLGGVAWRAVDDFAHDPAYDDRDVHTWEGSATVRWEWRVESFIGLEASRFTLPAFGSNVAAASRLQLVAVHRFPQRWRVHTEMGWLEVANTGGSDALGSELRHEWAAQVTAEYGLAHGYTIRLYAVGVQSRSRISQDYDRVGAASQLIAVF